MGKYNILTDGQFGFRKGKSCVTNLLSYYDRVAETMQEIVQEPSVVQFKSCALTPKGLTAFSDSSICSRNVSGGFLKFRIPGI